MAYAPKHGKNGAFYAAKAILRDTTIGFTISPATITDSGNRFITQRFAVDMKVIAVGSVSNDTTHTVTHTGLAAGALTVGATTSAESAGALITLYEAAPGGAPFGFTAWTLNWTMNPADATDFQDAGAKKFIPGTVEWSGTAERNYCESDDLWGVTSIWAGAVNGTYQWVRLFTQYAAVPTTAPNAAYYYEGLALVTASDIVWPSGGIVTQKFSFQGVGELTPVTKTSAW